MPGFAPRVGLSLATLSQMDKEEHKDDALISVAAYGEPDNPKYAAIWHTSPDPQLPRRFMEHRSQDGPTPAGTGVSNRFSPIFGTATGDIREHGHQGVTTLWVYKEYEPADVNTMPNRVGIIRSSLAQIMEDSEDAACASLDAVWYREPYSFSFPKVRYIAVLVGGPKAVFGVFRPQYGAPDLNPNGVHSITNIATAQKGFKRVHVAIPAPKNSSGKRPIVAHMRGDTYESWPDPIETSFKGGTVVDGPIDYAGLLPSYQKRAQEQGLTAIQIGANGIGNNIRFCITWAPTLNPKKRKKRLVDGAVPDVDGKINSKLHAIPAPTISFSSYDDVTTTRLGNLRNWAFARMKTINCSNAQIAIAVDGKLKLFWNLTYAEDGWPLTQPTSKMRFASCVKTLLAMRAVSLGEAFLKRSILEAMGANVGFALNRQKLEDSTVEDCLRMVSGWRKGDGFKDLAWLFGRQNLPLKAGDLTLALSNSPSLADFSQYTPRTVDTYNNTGFVAVSEALGRAARDDSGGCLAAMRDWWPDLDPEKLIVVPPNRAESLGNGEPPMRDRVCVERNTDTTKELESALEDEGQLPPFVPGGYRFRDCDMTTRWTMSAATMTRLLQMMHPPDSEHSGLPGNRLSASELLRMASVQEEPLANGDTPEWSLGCKTRVDPNYIEFSKGGSFGSGKSTIHHFTFFPISNPLYNGANVHSMSIAAVTNCGKALAAPSAGSTIRKAALKIYRAGGWNNNVDLYPDLDLV